MNAEQNATDKITVREAAARARVSASLVYTWCQEARLPHYRLGAEGKRGRIVIAVADLDRFLGTCLTERHALLAIGE